MQILIQEIKGSFMKYLSYRRGNLEFNRVEDHCPTSEIFILSMVNCYEHLNKHVCSSEDSDYISLTFKTKATRTVSSTQQILHNMFIDLD